ncbi:MAG: hypothetical protein HC810_05915 [Acaryochloridaceae cyanobacterium RL_2_7]|nr:hypothetical protein [Acaryochloridaceae cyanobacterium RL_2_7]
MALAEVALLRYLSSSQQIDQTEEENIAKAYHLARTQDMGGSYRKKDSVFDQLDSLLEPSMNEDICETVKRVKFILERLMD